MVYLYCEKVKGDTSSCNDLLYISIPTQKHFDKQSRCFCFIKEMKDKATKEQIKRFYKTKAWKLKREEILKRDNYECQECKKQGKVSCVKTDRIDIHHIKHLLNNYSLRLSNNNLIALCSSCHDKMHPEKVQKESKYHKAKFE